MIMSNDFFYKGRRIPKNVLGQNAQLISFEVINTVLNTNSCILIFKYYSQYLERYIYCFGGFTTNIGIITMIKQVYKSGFRLTFDEFQMIKKMG